MSWSIGYDEKWQRDIGYGVPAYCDYPGCMAQIDRGLSYVCCDSQPYGGDGCGLYFCERHLQGKCERCEEGKAPFDPTPDHPMWVRHKLIDPSWKEWRDEHPEVLRSCPFCGGDSIRHHNNIDDRYSFCFFCVTCGAQTGEGVANGRSIARDDWNRRATDDSFIYHAVRDPEGHIDHTTLRMEYKEAVLEFMENEDAMHLLSNAFAVTKGKPPIPLKTWEDLQRAGYSVVPVHIVLAVK